MQRSGSHDNDPWNYVDAAMGKSTTGLTNGAVYYIYVRCE